MTSKIQKVFAIVAVAISGAVCATDGCSVAADAFLEGLNAGYMSQTGESLLNPDLFSTDSSSDSSYASNWNNNWSYGDYDWDW